MIDYILRLCGCFDSNGLRWSKAHLQKVSDEIANYSIYEQCLYADKHCVTNIHTTGYILNFDMKTAQELAVAMKGNPTMVGNIAYIALNSHVETTREKCKSALAILKNMAEWSNRHFGKRLFFIS